MPETDERKHYEGEGFSVSFHLGTCTHSAVCVRGLPGVFQPKRRPWIEPMAGERAEIEAQVARCPSGALRFHAKE